MLAVVPSLRRVPAARPAGARWNASEYVRRVVGTFGVALVAACGGEPAQGTDTTAARPAPAAVADSTVAQEGSGGGCPEWGRWQRCSVEQRLERAGVVLTPRAEPVRHAFLSAPGIVYENARVELQVFLYPSAAERGRETSALDSVAVAPAGQRIVWRWPATLVTSDNLAAIILSLNERSVERIALALGAGLPAAPPR